MSRAGLISLGVAFVCLGILMAARFILGGWIQIMYVPLAGFLFGVFALLFFDRKSLIDFLSMRTTKHGMNMGVVILLGLVLVAAVNFLAARYNKTLDLTKEKLNSLSEQTLQVLKGLQEPVEVLVFYKGEQAEEARNMVKQGLTFFIETAPNIKVRYVNTYLDNILTQTFLNDLSDKTQGEVFVFVNYQGKRVRVEISQMGLTEEALTSAIVRASRRGAKKLYFTQGHGERDLNSSESDGLKELKEALEGAGFLLEPLNLVEKGQLPEDAAVIAVVGPSVPLLDSELELLLQYAKAGGKVLVAADPGQRHNISMLMKPLGAEFKNNYILNQISQLVGRGVGSAIGLMYSQSSEITRKFQDGSMSVFDLASEITVDSSLPESLRGEVLLRTHQASFAVNELSSKVTASQDQLREHSLVVLIEGNFNADAANTEEGENQQNAFAGVFVGDSDFLANKGLYQGVNRDLALNIFSYLAQEEDLISIRPKQPDGTQIMMTRYTQVGLVSAGVGLPVVLLILSGVFWYRRRSL